jgi:WD40 repeat protein
MLAVGGRSGVVRVFTANRHIDLSTGGRRVNAVAFSPDGQQLAIGGEAPNITIWNPKTGQRTTVLPERPGKTFSLTFCGNGLLASGESDNAIRIWDIPTRKNTKALIGHTGTISSLVYEPSKKTLISGSFDTTVRFWEIP